MTGSLVPLRVVVIMGLFIIGIMFYPLRLLQWNRYAYACTNGKSFTVGEEIIQIGRLSIHGFRYDCPDGDRYNPKQSKPILNTDPTKLPDFTN